MSTPGPARVDRGTSVRDMPRCDRGSSYDNASRGSGARLKLGVVGHEQAKFTPETEAQARRAINDAIDVFEPEALVSGHCPLGGVDIYAEEIAAERGMQMIVHAPRVNSWGAPGGYKARNLRIARDSDLVLCVSLRELPDTFDGMRFEACYHCAGRNPPHVKGGGCWTAWKCKDRIWVIL
jgi:hypothetical protein